MNKDLMELVMILDRSGSMSGLEEDTIGGYNSMLEKQKKGEKDVLVTTVLFDDLYEVLHDRVSIKKIRPITEDDYYTRGCTALLDAVGRSIEHVRAIHKYAREEDRPAKTLFVITTDGMENASRNYDYDSVKRLVEKQKEASGWEFVFLGANMDAISTASNMGIDRDRAVDFYCDSEGIRRNFEAVDCICDCYRCDSDIGENWKAPIEEYKNEKDGE